MLVVDTRATGAEIWLRSMFFPGVLAVELRPGSGGTMAFFSSDRFMRLVRPRAIDIM